MSIVVSREKAKGLLAISSFR